MMYRRLYAYRYALWRAFDMKCFYCWRPIDIRDVEIDHVLPKSLEANPAQLSEVEQEYEIRETFPDFDYVSLEDPDMLAFANEDPRGFLDQYSKNVIFDEIQNCT